MIPRFLTYIAFGVVTLILETTIFSWIPLEGVVPALSFLVIIYYSFIYGSFEGVLLGFVLGLFHDFSHLGLSGFHSLLYTIFSFALGKARGKVQLDLFLIPVGLFVVSYVVRFLLLVILSWGLGLGAVTSAVVSLDSLMEFLYTLVFVVPMFLGFRWFDKALLTRSVYT